MRFPLGPEAEVTALLRAMSEPKLGVGDDRIVAFLSRCSRSLLSRPVMRAHPELAPLGFFLRRAELERHLTRLAPEIQGSERLLRFARGLAFHVPPANVDTIFLYTWALSALAGNRNVVRISPRAGGAAAAILDILNDVLSDTDPVVGETQKLISYGRDDSITSELCSASDLRVLWGGDASVNAIRRHPLGPMARDLTFPDRSSFAAASVAGWERATTEGRRQAVRGFFNDAYWFDQAACSSPRSLLWIGTDEPACQAAPRVRRAASGDDRRRGIRRRRGNGGSQACPGVWRGRR